MKRALLAKDICEGMHFLHSQKPPVIHRDLKSPNILLSFNPKEEERMMCKIGDFGLSRGYRYSIYRYFIKFKILLLTFLLL